MRVRLGLTGSNPRAGEQVSTKAPGPSELSTGQGFGRGGIDQSGPPLPQYREKRNSVAYGHKTTAYPKTHAVQSCQVMLYSPHPVSSCSQEYPVRGSRQSCVWSRKGGVPPTSGSAQSTLPY